MPALQRARRRIRPRRARHPRGPRDGLRRLDRGRPEGVDLQRTHRPLGHPDRPHRPRTPQTPGHHLLPLRHARPRRRGPAAAPDHRRGRVQRGLPHRRPHPRQPPPGRGGRGLGGRPHHPDERAGLHRRHAHPARGRHDRAGRRRLARAPRAAHPRPPPAAAGTVGRGRGRPPHRGTAAPAARRRPARPRGIGHEAHLRPAQPGDQRTGGRTPRRGGPPVRGLDDAPARTGRLHRPRRRLPLPARQGQQHRGRHQRNPPQHRRRTGPRPAPEPRDDKDLAWKDLSR